MIRAGATTVHSCHGLLFPDPPLRYPEGMTRRVLFLNPPGAALYLRDNYCSKRSKASYLYHPVDLLVQWALHERAGWQGSLVDAMAESLDRQAVLQRILRFRPQRIVGLVGWVCLDEDADFYRWLGGQTDAAIWLGGDRLRQGDPRDFSIFPRAAGFLLDYSNPHLAEAPPGQVESAPALQAAGWRGPRTELTSGERSLGQTPWAKIPFRGYTYPFARSRPLATLITSTGCPHRCPFCINGTLPWVTRPLTELAGELKELDTLGYRELYFADSTLNADRDRFLALCQTLAAHRFHWSAFVRRDLLDERQVRQAAAAGCHTMIFGIENANEAARRRWGKAATEAELRESVRLLRRFGIRSVGTFVLGLPGDGPDSPREAADLAIRLDLDFVSLNTAVPRPGTRLFREGAPWPDRVDQSGGPGLLPGLPAALQGRKLIRAMAAADRRFYLRPTYLLRRLTALRSLSQLRTELTQATALFRSRIS